MYTLAKQYRRVILALFPLVCFVILQFSVFIDFTFLRFIYFHVSSDDPNMLVRKSFTK